MRLFETDREAFYLLATNGLPGEAASELQQVVDLAAGVRMAVRESYWIQPSSTGADVVAYSGNRLPIPERLIEPVREFLRTIDGKTTDTRFGKDYEGSEITEAEMRFKLGDSAQSSSCAAKSERALDARPFVLRVAEEDLESLKAHPPYVVHELLHCARRVVLAPTRVYRGLKRSDRGMPKINQGWAFCGRPRQGFDNAGNSIPEPDDKVFVVYADADGYVFDWDWIQQNPDEDGCPFGPDIRFDGLADFHGDVVLDLPPDLTPGRFDAHAASYSERGDCIFCYLTDEVSYAERVNADLTVFRALRSKLITGFKIKNVCRILEVDKSVVIGGAPELTVKVRSMLLVSLKLHPDEQVNIYDVLIEALFRQSGDPQVVLARRPGGRDQVPAQPAWGDHATTA